MTEKVYFLKKKKKISGEYVENPSTLKFRGAKQESKDLKQVF